MTKNTLVLCECRAVYRYKKIADRMVFDLIAEPIGEKRVIFSAPETDPHCWYCAGILELPGKEQK